MNVFLLTMLGYILKLFFVVPDSGKLEPATNMLCFAPNIAYCRLFIFVICMFAT
jgi:hypothetical protein